MTCIVSDEQLRIDIEKLSRAFASMEAPYLARARKRIDALCKVQGFTTKEQRRTILDEEKAKAY